MQLQKRLSMGAEIQYAPAHFDYSSDQEILHPIASNHDDFKLPFILDQKKKLKP